MHLFSVSPIIASALKHSDKHSITLSETRLDTSNALSHPLIKVSKVLPERQPNQITMSSTRKKKKSSLSVQEKSSNKKQEQKSGTKSKKKSKRSTTTKTAPGSMPIRVSIAFDVGEGWRGTKSRDFPGRQ